jgi:hypothetical protein
VDPSEAQTKKVDDQWALMSEFTESVPGTTVVLQVTLHHREIDLCPVLRVEGEEYVGKLLLKV